VDLATTAFPWSRLCQNPRLIDQGQAFWPIFSVGIQVAVLLLALGVGVAAWRIVRRESRWMSPPRFENILIFLVFMAALVFGRRSLGAGDPDGVRQMLLALEPAKFTQPLDLLLSSGLAYWVRLFGPHPAVVLGLHALMALIGLWLVYILAMLVWGNRRFALVALALAGLSVPYLSSFAVDAPLHLSTTVALAAIVALLLAMHHGSWVGWLSMIPLGLLSAWLTPATVVPLLVALPGGSRTDRPAAVRRMAALVWIAGLTSGVMLRIASVGKLDVAIDAALMMRGAGVSLVVAMAFLVGFSIAARKRQIAPLGLALAGLAALVVLPTRPAYPVLSGAYAWLGLALVLPLAARGVWELAAWVSARHAHWVVAVMIAGALAPAVADVLSMPPDEVDQVYAFESRLIEDLSVSPKVLYMDVIRQGRLPQSAGFLAPVGGPLCLRDREHLNTDPTSHGDRWIYFGPECGVESPLGTPGPSDCRFYRQLYELADCRSEPLMYFSDDGRTTLSTHLEACRVVGLQDAPDHHAP
jgi:hypothetical protein